MLKRLERKMFLVNAIYGNEADALGPRGGGGTGWGTGAETPGADRSASGDPDSRGFGGTQEAQEKGPDTGYRSAISGSRPDRRSSDTEKGKELMSEFASFEKDYKAGPSFAQKAFGKLADFGLSAAFPGVGTGFNTLTKGLTGTTVGEALTNDVFSRSLQEKYSFLGDDFAPDSTPPNHGLLANAITDEEKKKTLLDNTKEDTVEEEEETKEPTTRINKITGIERVNV